MFVNIIGNFISLTVFFMIFFFSTPYWEASEMSDLSSSGIWRGIYRVCATIGTIIFRICEIITNFISNLLHIEGTPFASVFNLALYTGVFYTMLNAFDAYVNSIFSFIVVDVVESNGDSLWGMFSRGFVIFRIIVESVKQSSGIGDFFSGIASSICFAFGYYVSHILFMSIVFGFLQFKVTPLVESLDDLAEDMFGEGFLNRIKYLVVSFICKLTRIGNFEVPGVSLLFILGALLISVVGTLTKLVDFIGASSLFMYLLDSLEILDLIASFLLSYLLSYLACFILRVIISRMPIVVQETIQSLSDRGNSLAQFLDERRYEWAVENCRNSGVPEIRGHFQEFYNSIRELHLH